MRLHS